jgi:hypothetical protein
LAERSVAILERNGVSAEVVRAVDHDIVAGVHLDMTEHGWERDEWPSAIRSLLGCADQVGQLAQRT